MLNIGMPPLKFCRDFLALFVTFETNLLKDNAQDEFM